MLGMVLLGPYDFYLSLALIKFFRRTLSLNSNDPGQGLPEQEHMRYSSHDIESG